jgi:succinate dehydrogenase flavin-adding protein (antitoxin of CptAB toxin-antitoxin module)
MVVNMIDRKVKSNRAQADYFELLVCQYICSKYNIRFTYSKNLAELSNLILDLPNGKERLELQKNNLLKLTSKLDEILNYEVSNKGEIIDVIWVGRKLIIKTVSDVNVEHVTHKLTKFSIKSIFKTGLGTIKNIGMRSIKKFFNIDFKQRYEEMWNNLRSYLNEPKLSRREIKNMVIKDNKLLKWAFENGQKYQMELNNLCFKAFNNLSQEKKVNFLNFVLDANDPDLYVIIVNAKGVLIYKPFEKRVEFKQIIEARDNTGVGYTIYIDDIPAYRVQTNATNGIGISPFCQRVFFAGDVQNE